MGRWKQALDRARASPANVRFQELCSLVEHLGFKKRRQAGSYRIYQHQSRPELPLINLQADRSVKAKPYQVRQVLALVDTHRLEVKP